LESGPEELEIRAIANARSQLTNGPYSSSWRRGCGQRILCYWRSNGAVLPEVSAAAMLVHVATAPAIKTKTKSFAIRVNFLPSLTKILESPQKGRHNRRLSNAYWRHLSRPLPSVRHPCRSSNRRSACRRSLQNLEQANHLTGLFAFQLGIGRGNHGHLVHHRGDAGCLHAVATPRGRRIGDNLPCVALVVQVFAACSSTMSISCSSVAAPFSTAMSPFLWNMNRTEPDSPRFRRFLQRRGGFRSPRGCGCRLAHPQ